MSREALHPSIRFLDFKEADRGFEAALIAGLSRPRKAIPCRFLYDRRGSQLFDRICTLPEYYPTRMETAILRRHAAEIARLVGAGATLIELGSGSSIKTRILLDAMDTVEAYAAIDISGGHLRRAATAIAEDYAAVAVTAICANYATDWPLPDPGDNPVAFFPGSTIGNFEGGQARALLKAWRRRLGSSGKMIVGVDLKKPKPMLDAAYNDSAGVTERFIRNVLERANREAGADFDLSAFDYEAEYAPSRGRVEMRLRSAGARTVTVAGREFELASGEAIHIENSRKYELAEFRAIARGAGFGVARVFTDPGRLFSVWVLSADRSPSATRTPEPNLFPRQAFP